MKVNCPLLPALLEFSIVSSSFLCSHFTFLRILFISYALYPLGPNAVLHIPYDFGPNAVLHIPYDLTSECDTYHSIKCFRCESSTTAPLALAALSKSREKKYRQYSADEWDSSSNFRPCLSRDASHSAALFAIEWTVKIFYVFLRRTLQLSHACRWLSRSLVWPILSCVTNPLLSESIFFSSLVSICRWSSSAHNRVHPRRVDASALVFSLSSHRNPSIVLVFTSRFKNS